MTKSAVDSVLEVANWFSKRAESTKIYLEDDKLHAFVFLAQVDFALKNNNDYLAPCLFVCNNDGFFEPSLKKILEFGMPLMGEPKIDSKIKDFLELVWKRYTDKNSFELIGLMKESPAYRKHHIKDETTLVSLKEMCAQFGTPPVSQTARKILLSQNGPVVVSKWQPRKLNKKGEK